MNRIIVIAFALLVSPLADAQMMPHMDRGQRESMLKKIHTGFVLELGELLGLDTAGTIKLSERLAPYDKQRVQLRLDSWDAMQSLKQIAAGKGSGNAADLARRMSRNRVQIAQIDQEELEEVLKGLAPDKVSKVAVFAIEYPKRIERMGREILRDRMVKPGEGGSDHQQEE
jgi:hypothetical protein